MKKSELDLITREDIINAINEYNNSAKNAACKNYFLVYDNDYYPSKEIIKIAYNKKFNLNITSNDFNGGKQWINFYKKLGFEIVLRENKSITIENSDKKI